MGLTLTGFSDLENTLAELASRADGDAITTEALQGGAEIIKNRMIANASHDPHPRSGALRNAIKIGDTKRRSGRVSVPVGVWSKDVPYAFPVEYGHGGPHPAPAHPFIRPAFDEGQDEAFASVKSSLNDALGR